jgi:hypothetical protein
MERRTNGRTVNNDEAGHKSKVANKIITLMHNLKIWQQQTYASDESILYQEYNLGEMLVLFSLETM